MDWQITQRITTLGLPIGLTIVAESGMFIAIGLIIGTLVILIDEKLDAWRFAQPLGSGARLRRFVGRFSGCGCCRCDRDLAGQ